MSQMGGRPPGSVSGPSNIFTVLAIIACIALAVSVGYLVYKNQQITGAGNPFVVVDPTRGR